VTVHRARPSAWRATSARCCYPLMRSADRNFRVQPGGGAELRIDCRIPGEQQKNVGSAVGARAMRATVSWEWHHASGVADARRVLTRLSSPRAMRRHAHSGTFRSSARANRLQHITKLRSAQLHGATRLAQPRQLEKSRRRHHRVPLPAGRAAGDTALLQAELATR